MSFLSVAPSEGSPDSGCTVSLPTMCHLHALYPLSTARSGPRAAPAGTATLRKWHLEVCGVFLCLEVHFLTRVVTHGPGGATLGSAAGPGASLGVSWHLLCVCSGLSMENYVSFRDSIEGFDVISAVNAAFRIVQILTNIQNQTKCSCKVSVY